jgi:alpha-glucosidase
MKFWRAGIAAVTMCLSASAQTPASHTDATWWKHAVIDELYPRSYQDSNGDGVGDLAGMEQRLGYLQGLGVDAIWIAPMYPSPQVDFGYDISDYENVDPQYGTLADFDRLEAAAKQHHIRILLDMVLNHTSDKHKWFVESESSLTNPKADWYVWNDGIAASSAGAGAFQKRYVQHTTHGDVVPPNNWESLFGGSAWEWNPARQQFYYHKFYKQQPDLNWRNPAVEAAMFAAMRFWLDRGVAGFRLDAITTLFEDPQLRNEVETGCTNKQGDPCLDNSRTDDLPEDHDVIRRMRAMVETYPGDRVLIGETYLPNTATLDKWYGGEKKDELQLPMDMLVGFGDNSKLNATYFRKKLNEAETQIHGSQPLIVFDNHDNVRSIDRYGDGTHDVEIAKLLATMLFTSRATALTYYGAEIGMRTETPTRREYVKDPIGITGWPKEKGRDGERTPMQWTPGPQAGFSTNPHTWLPIPANHTTINVQTEEGKPDSLLNWYKRLIALRRSNAALRDGEMRMLPSTDPDVLAYVRQAGAEVVVAVMNMSAQSKTLTLSPADLGTKSTKVHTLASSVAELASVTSVQMVTLPPFSSWVVEVR